MRVFRLWLGLSGTLVLAGLPAPARAQPAGPEFQINTYTPGLQLTQSSGGRLIAPDGSGGFIVVWNSCCQDGDFFGVFGRRYDSGGVPQANEFRINSFTTLGQAFPSVASDANGEFVVAWQSFGQDGDSYRIFGQRYDSAGGTLGSEFQVNSSTTGNQQLPSVARANLIAKHLVAWGALALMPSSPSAPSGSTARVPV